MVSSEGLSFRNKYIVPRSTPESRTVFHLQGDYSDCQCQMDRITICRTLTGETRIWFLPTWIKRRPLRQFTNGKNDGNKKPYSAVNERSHESIRFQFAERGRSHLLTEQNICNQSSDRCQQKSRRSPYYCFSSALYKGLSERQGLLAFCRRHKPGSGYMFNWLHIL